MIANSSKKKQIMVVITRAYADVGASNDEFVHEWGYPAFKKNEPNRYEWREIGDVLLLVIHGRKANSGVAPANLSADIKAAFAEAVAERGDRSRVYCFHHALKEEEVPMRQTIRAIVKKGRFHDQAYGSEGGPAVEGLVRILDRQHNLEAEPGQFTKFLSVIQEAASGRRMFAAKVYALRGGLLRLRLLFDSGVSDEFYREGNRVNRQAVDILDAGSRWTRWWRQLGLNNESKPVQRAVEMLGVLAHPRDDPDWSGFATNRNWVKMKQHQMIGIRSRFESLGRALDVLIGATNTLTDDGDGTKQNGEPES